MMMRTLPLCLGLMLAGCTDFPQVGRAEEKLSTAGNAPALLTSDELAALTEGAVPDRSGALADEAAALRAKAKRLRRR